MIHKIELIGAIFLIASIILGVIIGFWRLGCDDKVGEEMENIEKNYE